MVRHSSAGRLSGQDAVFHRHSLRAAPALTQETEALLSLPEFIRESVPPASLSRTLDPHAMLTLPEFFKEQQTQGARGEPTVTTRRASGEASTLGLQRTASRQSHGEPIKSSSTAPQLRDTVNLIKKMARNRSNSAPPLALSWFKHSKTADGQRAQHSLPLSREASTTQTPVSEGELRVPGSSTVNGS